MLIYRIHKKISKKLYYLKKILFYIINFMLPLLIPDFLGIAQSQ